MAKKYKYLDKTNLLRINYLSHHVLKYNRTLPDELIDALPDDKLFPITFTMLHEHRAGVACEPHVRCIINAPNQTGVMQTLILDVDMVIYNCLPEVEIPDAPTNSEEPVGAT